MILILYLVWQQGSTPPSLLWTASDRTKVWPSLWRLDWRKDLFSSDIQVFEQFWQVCWRWVQDKTEATHASLVIIVNTKHSVENLTSTQVITIFYVFSVCVRRCDRILWYGTGLNQLSYVRGESRLSDHRPVYSVFTAEVESIDHSKIRNMSCPSSRIEVEELLPYSHGYTDLNFF